MLSAWTIISFLFPLGIGLYICFNLWTMGSISLPYVMMSVLIGFTSTLAVVVGYRILMNDQSLQRTATKLSIKIDQIVWGLISLVLLTFAISFFNRAMYNDGIFLLESSQYKVELSLHFFHMRLSLLDIWAIVLAIVLFLILVLLPRWNLPKSLGDLKGTLNSLQKLCILTIIISAMIAWLIWKSLPLSMRPSTKSQDIILVTLSSKWWVTLLAAVGLLLVLISYFTKMPLIVEFVVD